MQGCGLGFERNKAYSKRNFPCLQSIAWNSRSKCANGFAGDIVTAMLLHKTEDLPQAYRRIPRADNPWIWLQNCKWVCRNLQACGKAGLGKQMGRGWYEKRARLSPAALKLMILLALSVIHRLTEGAKL